MVRGSHHHLPVLRSLRKAVEQAFRDFNLCMQQNPSASPALCPFHAWAPGQDISPRSTVRLGVGVYVAALHVWLSVWESSQLLVIRSEDLQCRPEETLHAALSHLDVTPHVAEGTIKQGTTVLAKDHVAPVKIWGEHGVTQETGAGGNKGDQRKGASLRSRAKSEKREDSRWHEKKPRTPIEGDEGKSRRRLEKKKPASTVLAPRLKGLEDERSEHQAQDGLSFAPSPEAMKRLRTFYEPFNQELALLLNDTRFLWLDIGLLSCGVG